MISHAREPEFEALYQGEVRPSDAAVELIARWAIDAIKREDSEKTAQK